MKREYGNVKIEILTVTQDVITTSGLGDANDPNVDDPYDFLFE